MASSSPRLCPMIMGKDTVHGIFDEKDVTPAPGVCKFYEENPDTHEVVQYAPGLRLTRQWGVHACAVIMSSHTLTDIIPIMKRPAGRRDHHAVRSPDVRDAGPAQDGLPGPA